MKEDDICYIPAWEMEEKIINQELTSEELTEIFIDMNYLPKSCFNALKVSKSSSGFTLI